MTNVLQLFGDRASPGAAPTPAPAFEAFWAAYPRRVAKQDAARAWAKLKPAERVAALEALPAHCEVWAGRGDPRFIPHPATWLNGARWEDELALPSGAKAAADQALVRLVSAR